MFPEGLGGEFSFRFFNFVGERDDRCRGNFAFRLNKLRGVLVVLFAEPLKELIKGAGAIRVESVHLILPDDHVSYKHLKLPTKA